ncbi:MAG: protein YgfX [Nitrosomonadales bacterium]|nr:protein YgfX [Nitrosomonadales bacterium]
MSYYSVKPIHLNLKSSPTLAWIIGLATAMSCLIVLFLPMPIGLKVLSLTGLVAVAIYYICLYATLVLQQSVHRLSLTHDSKLQLVFGNGATTEVQVLESTFVAAYLTVLNTKELETGKRISIILMADNAEPDSFRQLRVWLRWGRELTVEIDGSA